MIITFKATMHKNTKDFSNCSIVSIGTGLTKFLGLGQWNTSSLVLARLMTILLVYVFCACDTFHCWPELYRPVINCIHTYQNLMIKCKLVMTLEKRSDSTATDVTVKSVSSQRVAAPIGECSLTLPFKYYQH